MAKIQHSINDDLLERVQEQADAMYMTRAAYINNAIVNMINQTELVNGIKGITYAMRKIADNNAIDEESMEKLRDFERIAKLISGAK